MYLSKTAAIVALILIASAETKAADQPSLKPGIWKETSIETAKGQPPQAARTFQKCLDAAWIAGVKKMDDDFRKGCTKYEVHESKGKWIEDSICVSGKWTKTQHAEITWVGDSSYHKELDDSTSPSATSNSQFHSVLDGVWLGPCKAK